MKEFRFRYLYKNRKNQQQENIRFEKVLSLKHVIRAAKEEEELIFIQLNVKEDKIAQKKKRVQRQTFKNHLQQFNYNIFFNSCFLCQFHSFTYFLKDQQQQKEYQHKKLNDESFLYLFYQNKFGYLNIKKDNEIIIKTQLRNIIINK
ncbi:unnamed protein product [Paramecium sonneborni]|uniref:Uncharacterized protein n=1 Tax=Paramecium sonneborni TaxID=65129 RepID=A0A8S1RVK2_9CILI|nr:unnamed protein product [Paramecium sonneborni]